jgi:hypothetical protein
MFPRNCGYSPNFADVGMDGIPEIGRFSAGVF